MPPCHAASSVCLLPPSLTHTHKHTQGLVVFLIDGQHWTLDLREGAGTVTQGPPIDKPDLTLTISDDNFAKMVMGKLSPQQVRGVQDCTFLSLARRGSLCGNQALLCSPSRALPSRTRRWLHAAALPCLPHAGIPAAQAEAQRQHGPGNEAAAHPRRSSTPRKAVGPLLSVRLCRDISRSLPVFAVPDSSSPRLCICHHCLSVLRILCHVAPHLLQPFVVSPCVCTSCTSLYVFVRVWFRVWVCWSQPADVL